MSRNVINGCLGVALLVLMLLYMAFITIPDAKSSPPPKSEIVFEIKDRELRIFEYETSRLICHIAIVDVRMIGTQISHTCVRKYDHHKPPEDTD